MVSHCAAVVANKDIHELLTVDDTVRDSTFLLAQSYLTQILCCSCINSIFEEMVPGSFNLDS